MIRSLYRTREISNAFPLVGMHHHVRMQPIYKIWFSPLSSHRFRFAVFFDATKSTE